MSESVFTIPALGDTRIPDMLGDLFPGEVVKVDAPVMGHIQKVGARTVARPRLACCIMTPTHSKGADDAFRGIMRHLPYGEFIGSRELVGLLQFLGTTEGMKHLAIPEGEDEINLVLGYIREGDVVRVVYVEHEFEDGIREIHLHARPAERWGHDIPRALLVLEEDT